MTTRFYLLLIGAVLCMAPISAQPLNILKDLLSGSGNGVSTTGADYALAGGKIYFPGTNSGFPIELCSTDGTAANTKVHGTVSAAEPEFITPAGSRVFFKAYSSGGALFASNTTSSGATLVKTFNNPYLEGIYPFDDTKVLLAVNDGTSNNPKQLWVSTASSATKIADIETRPDYMRGSRFGSRSVFYERSTNFSPVAPFITDGTAAGTQKLADWTATLTNFYKINSACGAGDLLFISGQRESGGFLYKKISVTDGTVTGTYDITFTDDILNVLKRDSATYFLFGSDEIGVHNPITKTTITLGYNADYFGQQLLHQGKAYYHTTGGTIWQTDGTTAGTKNLSVTPLGSSFYTPRMLAHDSLLYYTAKGANALELWSKNLKGGANTKVADIFPANGLIVEPILEVLNGRLVFSRYTDVQGFELWAYGNPPSGVFDLSAAQPLAVFPNPATDFVVLDLSLEDLGGDLSIFDQQGKVARQVEQVNATRVTLDGLGAGLYWLRYQKDGLLKAGSLVVGN